MKQIIGVHSGNTQYYCWNIDEKVDAKIGDFAIVENHDSFALVEIIGIIEIRDDYAKYRKNVVYLIPRYKLTSYPVHPNEDSLFVEEEELWNQ